jgi:hypothetical protein
VVLPSNDPAILLTLFPNEALAEKPVREKPARTKKPKAETMAALPVSVKHSI